MSTLDTVKTIRDALNKELPLEDAVAADVVERCQDLLDRLDECDMTYDLLADTMIGKTVSSFKLHDTLGPKAKALVKKWKKVAKQQSEEGKAPGATDHVAATSAGTPAATPAARPKPVKKKSSSATSRTSGDASAQAALEATAEMEWQGLPGIRQNICKKFFELVLSNRQALIDDGINAEAVDHLLPPRAAEIEGALWSVTGGDKKEYGEKARSLVFNLRKNGSLTQQVILGAIEAQDLVKMSSEDMVSEELKKKKEVEAKKLIESKRLDWEEANEDKINEMCGIKGDLLKASLFTCGRCKSTKTTSTQKQTRSADEPMTVFVLCLNCGKRWKC